MVRKMKNKFIVALFACLMIVLSSACSSNKDEDNRTYCFDTSYNDAMFMYLIDSPDIDKQFELMNKYFSVAKTTGKKPACGTYAHMGLLYLKKNDKENARKYFELEKTTFPYSSYFMDSVIKSKL